MHYLLVMLVWWFSDVGPLSWVSAYNRTRREAETAYRAADYGAAARGYAALTRLRPTAESALWLDLGHAYFRLKQYNQARQAYQRVTSSAQAGWYAVATVQLGVIACAERDSALALGYFQQALLHNPDNETARYNFELIKRLWSGKVPPKARPKTQTNQPRPQARSASGQEVAKSDRQDKLLKRFRNLNMSEQQALQLLNAMQDTDMPYSLIQRRRQPGSKADEGNRW